jgi:hypothetical protein
LNAIDCLVSKSKMNIPRRERLYSSTSTTQKIGTYLSR